jgi:hypothetical protein
MGKHDMPMRGELVVPKRYVAPADALRDNMLAVLAFCLFGLVATLYFAIHRVGLDQLPLLVIEYNLG